MTFPFLNWPWNALTSSCLMAGHIKWSLSRKISLEVLYAPYLHCWRGQTRKRILSRGGLGQWSWSNVLLSRNCLGEKVQVARRLQSKELKEIRKMKNPEMKLSPKQLDLTMIIETKPINNEAYSDYTRWIKKSDFKRKVRM